MCDILMQLIAARIGSKRILGLCNKRLFFTGLNLFMERFINTFIEWGLNNVPIYPPNTNPTYTG